jgi:hypothetical protein
MYQQCSFPVITLSGPLTSSHLFAAMPQFGALIDDLIVTTDEFIMGLRTVPTASALSSSRGAMSRTDPVPLVWSVALRASPDITIRASIGYVVPLPPLVSFICLVLRIGQRRKCIDLAGPANPDRPFPLGYWCNLWSSLNFTDQTLKNCLDAIHTEIVEIWNLYDRDGVSFPRLPCCFNCSTESVSVEHPIQEEYVSRRQRSSIAEVSVSQ